MDSPEKRGMDAIERTYLTRDEACLYLNIRRSKLYKISGVEVPYHKVGTRRWYLRADLDEYIASGRHEIYRRDERKPKGGRSNGKAR